MWALPTKHWDIGTYLPPPLPIPDIGPTPPQVLTSSGGCYNTIGCVNRSTTNVRWSTDQTVIDSCSALSALFVFCFDKCTCGQAAALCFFTPLVAFNELLLLTSVFVSKTKWRKIEVSVACNVAMSDHSRCFCIGSLVEEPESADTPHATNNSGNIKELNSR